jgi:hypothetical protein
MSKTPTYYIGKTRGIEAKDVVMDFQPDNYNLGTALTYLMRAGKKPNNPITQDIRKAIAHLEFELERQIHLQSQDEQRATSTTMRESMSTMQYYTNPAKRRKIDFLLAECASIFANCDSTYAARQQANTKSKSCSLKLPSSTTTSPSNAGTNRPTDLLHGHHRQGAEPKCFLLI